jgi:putative peptide zinc metalloprotease protein
MLVFNPNVAVYPFDSGHDKSMLLCEVPTEDANAPARYVLPAELIGVLRSFDGETEVEEILNRYVDRYSPRKLKPLVTQYCLTTGLLLDQSAAEQFLPKKQASRRDYLYIKLPLLKPSLVAKLAVPLSVLYKWPIVIGLTPLFVLTQILFFLYIYPQYHFNINSIGGAEFFLITLVTSLLGIVHELGHAAALHHYGGKRAEIGWGLYIIFTVFYTDLSEAWRFKRTHRAMVDIGGVYFHSICLVFLLGLIGATHSRLFVYSFFFVTMQVASSFNPLLRMDGYWFVADMFGISNLRRESLKMLGRLMQRVGGRAPETSAASARLGPRTEAFLLVYAVVSVGFFISLYFVMFNQLIVKLLPYYPTIWIHIWQDGHAGRMLKLFDDFGEALWKSIALYGTFLFMYRALKNGAKAASRFAAKRRSTEAAGSPTESPAGL